jgi:hypothetical protein
VSRRISDLSSRELLALVRRGGLDDFEMLDVLRSPFCTPQIAELVAGSREHLGTQAIREKLAGFPGLSNAQALNLLGSLPWSSLLAVAQTPKTPPLVRRQAERKLILQLPSMTLGEKIAMARRAHRALFPALMAGCDEKILIALLDNPRLVENDLVVLINTGEPPTDFYSIAARHHRWSSSYVVRRAIVECPRVPAPLALSILVQLPPTDQRRIAGNEVVSETIREAASALFNRRRGPADDAAATPA